jgi:hypothetical protein
MKRRWDWILVVALVACLFGWTTRTDAQKCEPLEKLDGDIDVALRRLEWREDRFELGLLGQTEGRTVVGCVAWGPHRSQVLSLVDGLARRRGCKLEPAAPTAGHARAQETLKLAFGQALLLSDSSGRAWLFLEGGTVTKGNREACAALVKPEFKSLEILPFPPLYSVLYNQNWE